MQIVCSWCKKFLGDKEPLSDRSITGSICEKCCREARGIIKEFRKERREEVVDIGERKMSKE